MQDDDSSQEGGPAIPSGVLRTSKKGWAGEELEIEHRNQHADDEDDYAAVNIKQFQNTQVGVGYQARGVIRQKTASETQQDVRDMSASKTQSQVGKKQPETKVVGNSSMRKDLDEYLSCDGIREFRKEIEQLLTSESKGR